MKTKTLLSSFGILNIIQGIFMFFNGRKLSEGVFPGVGEEAINVGEQMHMPLGTAFIGLGFILFICRSIELDASKRLLFSYSVFIGFVLLQALYNFLIGNHSAPPPIIILNIIIGAISFYGYKKGI